MEKIKNELLANPMLLLSWGYEFPSMTETDVCFNVNTNSFKGKVSINKEGIGYVVQFEKTNKRIYFNNPKEIIKILTNELQNSTNSLIPFC